MAARRIALGAVGGVLAVAALALAAPAAAQPASGQLQINAGHGWTSHVSSPLFDARDIVPGWTGTASVGVRNDSTHPGPLTLSTADVTGDGPLRRDLRLTVSFERGAPRDSAARVVWTGTVAGLTSPVTLARAMPAGAVGQLRIAAELPAGVGNADQGADVGFQVELRLQGQVAQVLGISGTHASRGGFGLFGLSVTGEPLALVLVAGVLALLAGAALLRAGGSWPRRRAAAP